MKKKILIIGINSFLGSNFYKFLINNSEYLVFGTINKETYRINKYLKQNINNIFKINLNKKNDKLSKLLETIKPNLIINFSGHSNLDISEKVKLNIDITKNLINSIIKSKIKIEHFYNVGSCEEYQGSKFKLNENKKLFSISGYGKHKISIHNYLLKTSKENYFKYTNLRTFNVLSKDKYKKNIITYIKSNFINKKINLHNKYAIRDFIWIDDYIFALYSILKNNKKNYKAINIGTGKGTSIENIIDYVQKKKQIYFKNINFEKNKKIPASNIKVANNDRLKKIVKHYEYLSIYKIIDKLI